MLQSEDNPIIKERIKIIRYIETNLQPENKESNETWNYLRKQILSGEYKNLDATK